jgi:hypothetical protein
MSSKCTAGLPPRPPSYSSTPSSAGYPFPCALCRWMAAASSPPSSSRPARSSVTNLLDEFALTRSVELYYHVVRASPNRMKRSFAIAVLVAQMLAGACVLYANGPQRSECASCCEGGATATGALTCACCRLDTPALPGLEASTPFTVPPPIRAALALGLLPAGPVAGEERFNSIGERPIDSSPPRLYLRNSILLI